MFLLCNDGRLHERSCNEVTSVISVLVGVTVYIMLCCMIGKVLKRLTSM